MAHIISGTRSRVSGTSKEWLQVGADIGQVANKYANRDDLLAYVGEGAGGEAPACFVPAIAEIEVNLEVAFGKGTQASEIGDIKERKNQLRFPKATGAVMHEAFHARYSQWSLEQAQKDLTRKEYKALELLEEGRIENQGLLDNEDSLIFLRACAMDIVLGDMKDEEVKTQPSTIQLTNLVGLVHARVDSGILDAREVEKLMELCHKELGEVAIDRLRDIAKRAGAYEKHNDATGLYPLAKEWIDVIEEVAKERGEELGEEEGEGTSIPMSAESFGELMDALEDAGVEVAINNFEEVADEEKKEERKEEAKAKAKLSEEKKDAKDIATKIFSKSSGDTSGHTSSRLRVKRAPTSEERSSAVRIGRALEKAKYRERDLTERDSAVPPGRLNSRAILQNSAMRARGLMATAKPFSKKVRKHTDDPTLSIGIMVDISGSMGGAMESMASTAWILAEAGHRVQAKTAMVYYGTSVFPTLKVGERLSQVNVFTAPDGTERFVEGFKALNGELDLLYGTGARLLVIVSDGVYAGEGEFEGCKEAIRKCKENGVAVLWIPFDEGSSAKRIGGKYPEYVTEITSVTDASERIGESAREVLTKIGRRA